MKKYLIFLLLFSFTGIAQTINNYKYVIVPVKFDFLSNDNQYRLNTLTKMYLNELGFTAFYTTERLPVEIGMDRCGLLYADVVKIKGLFITKLSVVFKDCQNNIIYSSEAGTSKEKEFESGYQEALKNTFKTIMYKYKESMVSSQPIANEEANETQNPSTTPLNLMSDKLKAETISNGYLIIDEATSKIALRLMKTSDPKTFIASVQSKQGVLIQKNDEWFFEYYQNDKLSSEKINIKF